MDKKLPLPKELRNIPKGWVYLGNGAIGYHNDVPNFKVGPVLFEGKIVHFYKGAGRHTPPYDGVFGKDQLKLTQAHQLMGDAGSGVVAFYFVKADSEIAKLNGHKPRNRKKKSVKPEAKPEAEFSDRAISVNLLVKDNEGKLHYIGYAAGYPNKDNNKIKIADFVYDLCSIGPKNGNPSVILIPNEWTTKEISS